MKKNLLIGSLILCLFSTAISGISGCSSSTSPTTTPVNPYSMYIDPNIFFTINFNGTALTTNGFSESSYMGSSFKMMTQCTTSTVNNSGNVISTLRLYIVGSQLNANRSIWNSPPYNSNIPLQKCDAHINLERIGDVVGQYTTLSDTSASSSNYSASITDITVGNKYYRVSPLGINLNITSSDVLYISGNFSFTLIDGMNQIPATGSFRLYK